MKIKMANPIYNYFPGYENQRTYERKKDRNYR